MQDIPAQATKALGDTGDIAGHATVVVSKATKVAGDVKDKANSAVAAAETLVGEFIPKGCEFGTKYGCIDFGDGSKCKRFPMTDDSPWDELSHLSNKMGSAAEISQKLPSLEIFFIIGLVFTAITSLSKDITLPETSSIDKQNEIEWCMRPYLIDFLIEAHAACSLLPESLFLTVNILDRYCSNTPVLRKYYQLVGCVALSIAAKYCEEKRNTPSVHELYSMCDGIYERSMFLQMETHILESLEWTIGHPTVEFFSQVFVMEEGDDEEVRYMAAYLCEIALYHRNFVSTKPSIMARSSLALARTILNRTEIGGGEEEETSTSIILSQYLHMPSAIVAHKYSTFDFCHVSQKLAKFVFAQATGTRQVANSFAPRIGVIDENLVFSNTSDNNSLRKGKTVTENQQSIAM
ncbi:hypothetical protein BFJ63_vAg14396 [Fusarium oxysporum f. sp. narcissi]|uniref:Uncharacterized protein n=1 Tax=Fusarium oxysporum f. sp. narcissi TaxID=451672 RepID=A0A4Q2V874_FUSOX|nr:hypothetical protein BFJ63_vAg14396 [Fusarium oxysporum f. sp. narcissi]